MTSKPTSPIIRTARGRPLPLGITTAHDGLNFALLCRHGTAVTLVVQPMNGSDVPIAEIALDPRLHRTGDHWHIVVAGLPLQGFRYGWRVDGPTGAGHRYDATQILLDPASPLLSGGAIWGAGFEPERHRTGRRSLYYRGPRYDWGDDAPPLVPHEETIVYELHVRGFTCHRSSAVSHPGTFAALAEKIPYLKWLGVTAVELLPIHEFNEDECPFVNPITGKRNRDFWGYNTIAFAAPKAAFAASAANHGQMHEFRDMVKAFHQAGIEVWLDVVFNHTGEGDDRGRTYSFRGLDNTIYYMLTEDGRYQNFTGCGNTMNCNHPIVRDLMMQCLRFWVGEMHVDGLRFRSGQHFRPQSKGRSAARAARHRGDCGGRRSARHQAGRRTVGRRRALSSRTIPLRRCAGANGMAAIATTCADSGAATPIPSADCARASPAPRTSINGTTGCRGIR